MHSFTIKPHTAEVSARTPHGSPRAGVADLPPVPKPTKELAAPLASFFSFSRGFVAVDAPGPGAGEQGYGAGHG